ncbi:MULTISPECIES: hypothetical protein [Streptomyces]|uniref:hypothetical protein n=1 Tax=Streptomyces TaxID=1883 RepID=UPI000787674D|nr:MULTISPECIES: hypothetical protein [unclassified Streptomyces]AVH95889.1 hypothetical protein C5L38_13050 [Streptomyces sp. WAC00288]KYG54552.1 hypothetical protein AWI43_08865 [Streptomyces sp. WAC04657]
MRDVIARALSWAFSILAPRRPGRHTAEFLTRQAEPVRTEPVRTDPWSKPWPTPTPEHVRARYAPLRGEDVALTRPYCRMGEAVDLGPICERRRAAVLATLGVDWPYGYDGDHFEALAAAAGAVPA